jgi:predicted GNAT family acetyltransferase
LDCRLPYPQAQDIDTALAQLYAELDEEKLLELVGTTHHACIVEELAPSLTAHSRHHALAVLQLQAGSARRALETWKKLSLGTLTDAAYPGLQ